MYTTRVLNIDVISVNDATVVSDSVDVDECEKGEDNCDENAQCANTIGSFECTCNSGYEGPGDSCTGKFVFVLHLFHTSENNLGILFRTPTGRFYETINTHTDVNTMSKLKKTKCVKAR